MDHQTRFLGAVQEGDINTLEQELKELKRKLRDLQKLSKVKQQTVERQLAAQKIRDVTQQKLLALLTTTQLQPQQCFDFLKLNSRKIETYLKQEDHLVLVALTKGKENPAVCTTRPQELKNLLNKANLFWECPGLHQLPDTIDDSYIKISFPEFQIYVNAFEYAEKIGSSKLLFFIPSGQVLKYTASGTALEGKDYVSAHHCQQGTEKQVWEIFEPALT